MLWWTFCLKTVEGKFEWDNCLYTMKQTSFSFHQCKLGISSLKHRVAAIWAECKEADWCTASAETWCSRFLVITADKCKKVKSSVLSLSLYFHISGCDSLGFKLFAGTYYRTIGQKENSWGQQHQLYLHYFSFLFFLSVTKAFSVEDCIVSSGKIWCITSFTVEKFSLICIFNLPWHNVCQLFFFLPFLL